jgi:hypothetical protein
MLKEVRAMAPERPQGDAGRLRAKRGRKYPGALQGLEPRTVHDVTLASGDTLDRWRADEATGQAAGCEFLKERHPGNARGFQGDRLEATGHTPIGERLESRGVRAKGAHELLGLAVRPAGHTLMGANGDASGMRGAVAHPREWTGFTLHGAGTMTLAELPQGGLLSRMETRA